MSVWWEDFPLTTTTRSNETVKLITREENPVGCWLVGWLLGWKQGGGWMGGWVGCCCKVAYASAFYRGH